MLVETRRSPCRPSAITYEEYESPPQRPPPRQHRIRSCFSSRGARPDPGHLRKFFVCGPFHHRKLLQRCRLSSPFRTSPITVAPKYLNRSVALREVVGLDRCTLGKRLPRKEIQQTTGPFSGPIGPKPANVNAFPPMARPWPVNPSGARAPNRPEHPAGPCRPPRPSGLLRNSKEIHWTNLRVHWLAFPVNGIGPRCWNRRGR